MALFWSTEEPIQEISVLVLIELQLEILKVPILSVPVGTPRAILGTKLTFSVSTVIVVNAMFFSC